MLGWERKVDGYANMPYTVRRKSNFCEMLLNTISVNIILYKITLSLVVSKQIFAQITIDIKWLSQSRI